MTAETTSHEFISKANVELNFMYRFTSVTWTIYPEEYIDKLGPDNNKVVIKMFTQVKDEVWTNEHVVEVTRH